MKRLIILLLFVLCGACQMRAPVITREMEGDGFGWEAWIDWLDVRDFGNPALDIGNSINLALAALPATGGTILLPADQTAFPLLTNISITKACQIIGMGRGITTIEKQADVVGFLINTATGRVTLRAFTLDSDGSDAGKNGITITQFQRGVIEEIEVTNQSNHGIEFLKGNLSSFRDLQLVNNGGDGFKVNASDVNCNACIFENIDCRVNAGWGFNLLAGNENWCIGLTTQFQNPGGGVHCDGYGNVIFVYSENNNGNDFELGANAKANFVHSVLPTTIVDGGSGNIIWTRGGAGDFMRLVDLRLTGLVNAGISLTAPTLTAGVNSTTRGSLNVWDGPGGNTAGYITLRSRNGTSYYFFVEDDGTLKIHNAAPVNNADGSAVGEQID